MKYFKKISHVEKLIIKVNQTSKLCIKICWKKQTDLKYKFLKTNIYSHIRNNDTRWFAESLKFNHYFEIYLTKIHRKISSSTMPVYLTKKQIKFVFTLKINTHQLFFSIPFFFNYGLSVFHWLYFPSKIHFDHVICFWQMQVFWLDLLLF